MITGVMLAGVITEDVTPAVETVAEGTMADAGRFCAVVFCASTLKEDEKHNKAANASAAFLMNSPGGRKMTLFT